MTERISGNELIGVEEAKAKFFEDFEDWIMNNQIYERFAEIVACHPDLPQKRGVEIDYKGLFLFFIYGMELARRNFPPANEVNIPFIDYDPEELYARHRMDGVNVLGNYYSKKLLKFTVNESNRERQIFGRIKRRLHNEVFENEPTYEGVPYRLIPYLITSGAHEYAHSVFEAKVPLKIVNQAYNEHHRHSAFLDHVRDKKKIEPEIRRLMSMFYDKNDGTTIYESCVVELMALIWEKETLSRYMSWEKGMIRNLRRRIKKANEARRRLPRELKIWDR